MLFQLQEAALHGQRASPPPARLHVAPISCAGLTTGRVLKVGRTTVGAKVAALTTVARQSTPAHALTGAAVGGRPTERHLLAGGDQHLAQRDERGCKLEGECFEVCALGVYDFV